MLEDIKTKNLGYTAKQVRNNLGTLKYTGGLKAIKLGKRNIYYIDNPPTNEELAKYRPAAEEAAAKKSRPSVQQVINVVTERRVVSNEELDQTLSSMTKMQRAGGKAGAVRGGAIRKLKYHGHTVYYTGSKPGEDSLQDYLKLEPEAQEPSRCKVRTESLQPLVDAVKTILGRNEVPTMGPLWQRQKRRAMLKER